MGRLDDLRRRLLTGKRRVRAKVVETVVRALEAVLPKHQAELPVQA